jgi:hypothetical protein
MLYAFACLESKGVALEINVKCVNARRYTKIIRTKITFLHVPTSVSCFHEVVPMLLSICH